MTPTAWFVVVVAVALGVGLALVAALALVWLLLRRRAAPARDPWRAMVENFSRHRPPPCPAGMCVLSFHDTDAGSIIGGRPDPPDRIVPNRDEAIRIAAEESADDDEMEIGLFDHELQLFAVASHGEVRACADPDRTQAGVVKRSD